MLGDMPGDGLDDDLSNSGSASDSGSGGGGSESGSDAGSGDDMPDAKASPTLSPLSLGGAGPKNSGAPKPKPNAGSSWDKWGGLGGAAEPPLTPGDKMQAEKERKERNLKKAKLCAKFDRRNQYRKVKIEYNPMMSLEELEAIDERDGYAKRSELSVKVLRRFLVFFCKIVEAASKRFPKLGIELEGWSETIYLTLDSYDEILYDVHDEYCSGVRMNPLAQLALQLGTNAIMYSMAKKLAESPIMNQFVASMAQGFQAPGQKSGETKQPQSQEQAAAAAAPPPSSNPVGMPMNNLASMFGSMFGAATNGQGDGDMGNGLDLNSIFSAVGNAINNAGNNQTQSQRVSIPSSISSKPDPFAQAHRGAPAAAPPDLRDLDLDDSRPPPPTERAPHVNDPRPSPALQGMDRQGMMLISVLRQQEDKSNLPTIQEIDESDDDEPPAETEETKSVVVPDPAPKRSAARGAASKSKVSIDDIK